ncbi:hypothetical protein CR513_49027, partial [Mucuna pruriens]
MVGFVNTEWSLSNLAWVGRSAACQIGPNLCGWLMLDLLRMTSLLTRTHHPGFFSRRHRPVPHFTILIKLKREGPGCLVMLMSVKVLHLLLLYQFLITQKEQVANQAYLDEPNEDA